jgi:hypothetical protein
MRVEDIGTLSKIPRMQAAGKSVARQTAGDGR